MGWHINTVFRASDIQEQSTNESLFIIRQPSAHKKVQETDVKQQHIS